MSYLEEKTAAWIEAQKDHRESVKALHQQVKDRESWVGPIQHARLMNEVQETYDRARVALGALNLARNEVRP